jgi:DNA-binding FadR family transcriptional regulator
MEIACAFIEADTALYLAVPLLTRNQMSSQAVNEARSQMAHTVFAALISTTRRGAEHEQWIFWRH